VRRLAVGTSTVEGFHAAPTLLAVSASSLVEHADTLLTECFGPAALIVEYASTDDLLGALAVIEGSLTATVHGQPDDEPELVQTVLDRLSHKAGRVIWDGWPTGVAVTWAQHHGGPWPASTAAGHTSVGVTAVRRFQRPVAYQNLPDPLLPPPLREANPWGLPRRVDAGAAAVDD
jgi:acyl-CoA reductase-like NAD-dependent aldehyde dehydrogenase